MIRYRLPCTLYRSIVERETPSFFNFAILFMSQTLHKVSFCWRQKKCALLLHHPQGTVTVLLSIVSIVSLVVDSSFCVVAFFLTLARKEPLMLCLASQLCADSLHMHPIAIFKIIQFGAFFIDESQISFPHRAIIGRKGKGLTYSTTQVDSKIHRHMFIIFKLFIQDIYSDFVVVKLLALAFFKLCI